MPSSSPGQFLFGDWNRSPLWALSTTTEEGRLSGDTLLPSGQIVFAIPVSTALNWRSGEKQGRVEAGAVAVIDTRDREVALELGGEADVVILGMRHGMLATLLESFRPGLAPGIRDLVYGKAGFVELEGRSEVLGQVVPALREPAVGGAARAFWFESQFKALLALLCFVPAKNEGEFFCSRQKRLARVRVVRAKAKLETRLDEGFDLNRLAAEVGCSPSYLSRTFSATTGMTLTQYLRKRRIETAAELLVTGRYNVSEVAVEVGYQSLSHFSKAFQQVKGCLPSKYELRTAARAA